MKRMIIASIMLLFLVCATTLSAHAELTPVRILIGGREAIVVPSPVWDGKRVLAPLSVLSSLGASYMASMDDDKIVVVSASGESGEIATVDVNKVKLLPMDKLLALIGGESRWDADTKTCNLTAHVQSVEFADETLKINCSFPVAYSVVYWTSNKKLIVDLASSKLKSEAREVYIGSQGILRARLGNQVDSARVVLDLEKDIPYKVISDPVTPQIQVKVSESLPKPKVSITQQPKSGRIPFEITGIKIDAHHGDNFDLVLATSAKGSASVAYGVVPPEIQVNLPGGTLEDIQYVGSSPALKDIIVDKSSPGKPKVTLQLKRIMVYSLNIENSQLVLSVRPPDRSGGKLSDKVIVLDPGHGGNQAGACCSGVMEKDVNVLIANELASELRTQGAKVILTRTSDVAMGLAARPEMALNCNADFFISIHCNSNGTLNSASGIETYYHKYEPSPMALAYAIHAGVCSTTGMCDRRPRSDTSLYNSGLAVLKRLENSGLPGILLECGYLNHSSDRAKLLDAEYRKKLAAGIVEGLKSYIEGK